MVSIAATSSRRFLRVCATRRYATPAYLVRVGAGVRGEVGVRGRVRVGVGVGVGVEVGVRVVVRGGASHCDVPL